jgi:small glutamine-rich tetratricopeptide repeat-containing protein alpha
VRLLHLRPLDSIPYSTDLHPDALIIIRHAQYSLADYKAAAAAYRRGLEIDPTNTSMKNDLKSAEARITDRDDDDNDDEIPPLQGQGQGGAGAGGGMADMLRNMGMGGEGGAGGGGGMPDLSSIMNNPMMMQMAQQMMANGGMDRLMNNPTVANMVRPYHTLNRAVITQPDCLCHR